jgi:putative peptide zinc metalloprotease protein
MLFWMLCPRCHRQIAGGSAFCPNCGASLNGSKAVFDLVLGDGTHVPLLSAVTIGRGSGNTLQLSDPSVSRNHAVIRPGAEEPVVEDAQSSYGTWVDGERVVDPLPLHDGSHVRVGETDLRVVRQRDARDAGRTLLVPVGESVVIDVGGDPELAPTADVDDRPRLRSGYALKRLAADEGPRRWVLNELRGGRFFHFSDEDATLLSLLDGRLSLSDLAAESERKLGPTGPARLARLLADLGSRGLLAGQGGAAPSSNTGKLMRQHEVSWNDAGAFFDRLYLRGGWLLFTRPAKAALALVALVGIFVFGFLIAHRYGTPFVVARKVGLGGLVFVVGRFAVAAVHETAHALTMASFGRQVRKAGFKVLLVFPYAFVDTSQAWFESRRRRIAISGAGPVSDFVVGGVFAVLSLAVAAGALRDILFQLAFAAYLGALFNLNPMLERDGYHILVDLLGEPGLRRRAREELGRRIRGEEPLSDSRVLRRYALLSLAWSLGAALFVAVLSLRYEAPLAAALPGPVAWLLIAGLWAALFTPVALMVGAPLRRRFA